MNDPLQESDIYHITKIKKITYEQNNYLCLALQVNDHDIVEGDELGLLSEDKIEHSVFVKKKSSKLCFNE